MITDQDKREAVAAAVEAAKRRLVYLNEMMRDGTMTRSEDYERDMTIDCIKRGQKLLGVEEEMGKI